MPHATPINKDAALFLSRKKRVTTVQESLNKFAMAVCSPVTCAELKKIMQDKVMKDETRQLAITLHLRPDSANPNHVWATMETTVEQSLGREVNGNLEL